MLSDSQRRAQSFAECRRLVGLVRGPSTWMDARHYVRNARLHIAVTDDEFALCDQLDAELDRRWHAFFRLSLAHDVANADAVRDEVIRRWREDGNQFEVVQPHAATGFGTMLVVG